MRQGRQPEKYDTIDAEAIAEAAVRPTMRFTQVRTTEQVDLQALHRIRDQLVSSRTRLINQVRAFCLEYGVAIRQGAGVFRLDLPRVLADETNDLTPAMRRMQAKIARMTWMIIAKPGALYQRRHPAVA